MTHTPGPWKRYRDKNGRVSKIEGKGHRVCTFQPSDPNTNNDSALIAAAPYMLEALEEVMGELDVEGLPCPLCGRDLTIGHRHNCLWHVVESAVRKARGEDA